MWSAGILRGHTASCPHHICKVYHTKPPPLVQSSNPDFPHFTHAVTVAASMEQVQRMILLPHARLAPVGCARHGQFGFFAGNFPDTVLWMWHFCRSGVAVSIRDNKVALFVPFCNASYQNNWSNYAMQQLPQQGYPAKQWWANGWLLCGDKLSDQLVGDSGMCALLNMLMVCCEQTTMHDCDFVINRRDSACVRLDGCDALNPIDAYQTPLFLPKLAPVLSQYVGDQFADVAMPLVTDWHRLSRGTFNAQQPLDPVALPNDIDWLDKRDCAVFRGTLTGTGSDPFTHQRLALLQFHDGIHFDLRATGYNQRYRYCPIRKQVTLPSKKYCDAGKHNFMPMSEQQETYRYSILIDGHSGADRHAFLSGGHQVVLKIDSPLHALCPDTWVSEQLHAWEHYIPVQADMRDLTQKLEWARSNIHACDRIRRNCKAWSSTERERIIDWWSTATKDMCGSS